MAKFPIERSTRVPPGVGPAVRARVSTFTGGQWVGQALQRAGGTLAQISEHRRRMHDTEAGIAGEALIEEALTQNRTFQSENLSDTFSWIPDLEQRMKVAHGQAGKLGMSEDAWTIFDAKYKARLKTEVALAEGAGTAQQTENTKLALTNYMINAVASGDPIKIDESMRQYKGMMPSILGTERAKMAFETVVQVGMKQREVGLIDALYLQAKALPIDERLEFINNVPGIREPVRNAVKARINTQNEIETERANDILWKLLRNDDLPALQQSVDIANLPIKEKKSWQIAIDKRTKEIATGATAYGSEAKAAELEIAVDHIWMGYLSMSNFKRNLLHARYIATKPEEQINQADFSRLLVLADKTLKKEQAAARNRIRTEVRQILVFKPDDTAFSFWSQGRNIKEVESAATLRQGQFLHLKMYMDDLQADLDKIPDWTRLDVAQIEKRLLYGPNGYMTRDQTAIEYFLRTRGVNIGITQPPIELRGTDGLGTSWHKFSPQMQSNIIAAWDAARDEGWPIGRYIEHLRKRYPKKFRK